jgi:uridine phosphorylase
MPARLRPTAPIAANALLVGDPGRALMLAQELLEQPKMSNHARGLWGYGGQTAAGEQLTIQSTGMGGPSATVVLADLAELGLRRAVRIGTCASLGDLEPGDLLLVSEARTASGKAVEPDAELARSLQAALPEARRGAVVSLDDLRLPKDVPLRDQAEGADMQTAALFAAAVLQRVAIAGVLACVEKEGGEALSDDLLNAAAKRTARAAAAVLSG